MTICFPVISNEGLDSKVFAHFGSAPHFIVVDTENGETTAITNADQHHSHGACHPLLALGGQRVDAVVVGGIGRGALMRLQQASVRVFQTQGETVRENIETYKNQPFREFMPEHTCGGHGNDHGCAH